MSFGVGILRGRRVFVTGSTSGIGFGIAQAFARAGSKLLFHGLEPESEIGDIKEKLRKYNPESLEYVSGNIGTDSGCKRILEEGQKKLGGDLEIVVNNAGIQFTAPTQDFPLEKWKEILAVCLDAPFFISKEVLPSMYKNKFGRLIHIGSAHSHVASPNKSAYCAAKHGVLGLSRAIALECAGRGVTSNVICPGWVLTPLVQKQIQKISETKGIPLESAQEELALDKHPTNEFVDPLNLGALAVFLSTNEASQINGASYSMDLGWTVR